MHIVQCTLYLYAQPHSVSHMSHVTYMMCTDTDTHISCCHTSHVSKQSTEHAAHKKKRKVSIIYPYEFTNVHVMMCIQVMHSSDTRDTQRRA